MGWTLAGRTAIVTGASSGIGAATVRALASAGGAGAVAARPERVRPDRARAAGAPDIPRAGEGRIVNASSVTGRVSAPLSGWGLALALAMMLGAPHACAGARPTELESWGLSLALKQTVEGDRVDRWVAPGEEAELDGILGRERLIHPIVMPTMSVSMGQFME